MLDLRLVTWSLGISTAISFVVCIHYGLATPASLPSRKWRLLDLYPEHRL